MYSLDGQRQWLDGGAMFGHCPAALWKRWIHADRLGRIELACRCLLIPHSLDNAWDNADNAWKNAQSDEDGYVLLETGIGNCFSPSLSERYGITSTNQHLLSAQIRDLGIQKDQIHTIVLSHLHFDHAGGLFHPPGQRELIASTPERFDLFADSQIIISDKALQRALYPHHRDKASYPKFIQQWLAATLEKNPGRLEIITSDQSSSARLGHSFEFLHSHGHTPGQLHTLYWQVTNGGETTENRTEPVFFCSDLIPGTPWIHLPITAGYDRFAEKVIDEKALIYSRALKEHWWMFFTHDPQVALAQITTDAQGRFTAQNPIYQKHSSTLQIPISRRGERKGGD